MLLSAFIAAPTPIGAAARCTALGAAAGAKVCLFNLTSDPFEATNLAPKLPDVVADGMGRVRAYIGGGYNGGQSFERDPAGAPRGGVWLPWLP